MFTAIKKWLHRMFGKMCIRDRIYIVYPIAEIAEMLDKGCTTIKGALNELDAAGLLERRRTGFSCANRLYVKVPDIPVVQFSDQLTDGKPP